ncbi:hypothetical protein [Brevundimonas denitrificans]|uniref:hypothetical protein n=1 Tax=Brevundimonas denitrificans TaxID=1443434 RepID=UPI00223ABD28|nr:hypothetical protein [Brevundimonas denitrificans]
MTQLSGDRPHEDHPHSFRFDPARGRAALALLAAGPVVLLAAAPAEAQAQDGVVRGRVSDQQAGAFFGGAEVLLVETGQRAVTGPTVASSSTAWRREPTPCAPPMWAPAWWTRRSRWRRDRGAVVNVRIGAT